MAPSIHAPGTRPAVRSGLEKAPTGIRGFDEISGGGLPRRRASLVTGGPGAGETLFGLEFLVRGARDFDEPGVLLAFEESAEELADDVASLGFDLAGLEAGGHLVVDACRVDATEFVTTGEFDLDGLFIRLSAAVQAVGARRVVLDTIEVLFGALDNEAVVRAEFSRLLRWLKDQGLTTLITGERGREGQLTRYGIEEYVSDCVIVLDHRMHDEIATRRLRIVKYRGSRHGTNEYPFLVTDRGLMIWPITSTQLTYPVSTDRVSLGVPRLDQMLTGGVHRGSTVLITGSAGTGKTTLAASAVDAACARGEPALFVSFEESPDQLVRNMRSVGIDLGRWVSAGLLRLWGQRATAFGLESYLAGIERLLDETTPGIAVLDAVGSLTHIGAQSEVTAAVAREVDMMKSRGITGILTSLTHEDREETSSVDASSLIDTWLLLRNVESDGERNRLLFVIKSRGTAHFNQVREFILTDHGPELLDVSVGPRGVLTEQRATETAALDRLVAEQSRGKDERAAVRGTRARRRQGGRDDPPPTG